MIPLSVPNLAGNEWKYIKECLDTNWVSSVGEFVNKFETAVAAYTGATYAISTVNGTAALHISLLLSDVVPGNYVIVPNITFIASVNAIKYVGAEPILIDIDPNTWQMDLCLLEFFLQENTYIKDKKCIHKTTNKIIKAIMPVHVLGNMCDMDKLVAIAREFHLIIVEDASESLGSFYKNQHSGTFGEFGCISFNGNKIITTGGGGMILTNNEKLAKRAKHLTTQAKSDPFEYQHDEVGYNYRLVNVLAAIGLAQMELLPSFLKRKNEISSLYVAELKSIVGLSFQKISECVSPNNWLCTITCEDKNDLTEYLLKHSIQVRPLWIPMNQLEMFKNHMYISNSDVSNTIYKKSISIPSSTGITNEKLLFVINKIQHFYLNL